MKFHYVRQPQLVGVISKSVLDGATRLTMQSAAAAEGGQYRQPNDVFEAFVIYKEGQKEPIAKLFNEGQAAGLVDTMNDLAQRIAQINSADIAANLKD